MKIRKKIVVVGTSSGIILDKVILKSLKSKAGDFVEIDIKKIIETPAK